MWKNEIEITYSNYNSECNTCVFAVYATIYSYNFKYQ